MSDLENPMDVPGQMSMFANASSIRPASGIRTPTPARRSDPVTSHEAARSVNVASARGTHAELLAYLLAFDDNDEKRTHEAIAAEWTRYPAGHTATSPSGLRTRLAELVNGGAVRDSGRKVRLQTGRRAIVWTLT